LSITAGTFKQVSSYLNYQIEIICNPNLRILFFAQRVVKAFTPEDYSEPRNLSEIALTSRDGAAATDEVIVVQQYHTPSYGTQV